MVVSAPQDKPADVVSTTKDNPPMEDKEQTSKAEARVKAEAKAKAKAKDQAKAKPSYHLLWSPGFLPSLVFWTVAEASVLYMILNTDDYRFFFEDLYEAFVKQNLLFFAHEYAVWSLVTLLSSACCAFQLVLNVFSVGCAGFNTVLGPLRPFFLAMATVGQAWMWMAIERPDLQRKQAVASSVLVFGMSLLPEAVWLWTNSLLRQPRLKPGAESGTGAESEVAGASACFKVTGMGCIACVNTITQSVLQRPGIKDVRVVLEQGTMEVEFCEKKHASNQAWLEALAASVTEAGFPTELMKGMHVQDDADEGEKSQAFPVDSLLKSVVAGLLSSSCCLLQLILNGLSLLNVIHVGCAGFNKALGGPVRTLLRTLTLCWLGYGWIVSSHGRRKGTNWRILRASAVTVTLMLLPELLTGMQKISVLPGRPLGGLLADIVEAPAQGQPQTLTVAFTIDNMGCEACVDLVSRVVDAHPGVLSSRIDFETGRAEIDLAEGAALNDTRLDEELQEHGYELHPEGWVTQKMKADAKKNRPTSTQ